MTQRSMHRAAGLVAAIAAASLAGCTPWFASKKKKIELDPVKCYIDAKSVLLQAAEDDDPVTRSHAMEALAETFGPEAGAVFVQALRDSKPAVRFAAALAIADAKYKPALGPLLKMAADKQVEPDKRVLCAVVAALSALGNDRYAGELGPMLFDSEPEVRMDAAMAMGRMGNASAITPLETVLANEQDVAVKLQLTESLAMLGDGRAAELLESYTKGYYLDLRLAAIPALARSGEPRVAVALRSLTDERQPARVRVSAYGQLARLGFLDDDANDFCVACVLEPEKVLKESAAKHRRAADSDPASLKCLAVLSLGWLQNREMVDLLHPLLKSRDGAIRVAAALSTLRLLKAYRPGEEVRPAAPTTPAPVTQPASQPAAVEMPTPAATPKTPKLHTAGGKD